MGNEIARMIEDCNLCQEFRPAQQQEPLVRKEIAERPFQEISVDLFEYGSVHFMVVVDRFSGWPIVVKFGALPNASKIIKEMRMIFRDYGIPIRMRSDGGRQFTSQEFREFLEEKSVTLEVSSAHYHQSNGHAEAAVKAMKDLVKKSWSNGRLDQNVFDTALLEWRNTPRSEDGKAPSQWMFGYLQRTLVPAASKAYERVDGKTLNDAKMKRTESKDKIEKRYNFRARCLEPLKVGDTVLMKSHVDGSWNRKGTVKEIRENGRSYLVLSRGSSLIRNRRLLKPCEGGHVIE